MNRRRSASWCSDRTPACELLALAIELLELGVGRPRQDLRGDRRHDAFAILGRDEVAKTLELRGHVGPETQHGEFGGFAELVGGDAAQKCDVLLSWLAADADALD